MNKKTINGITALFISLAMISVSFTGCGRAKEDIVTNKDGSADIMAESEPDTSLPTSEEESFDEEEEVPSEEKTDEKREEDRAISDTFDQAVSYILRSGGVTPEIDYETVKYKAAERDSELQVNKKAPKEIEERLKGDKVKKIRMHRSGNGATLDFDVYTYP